MCALYALCCCICGVIKNDDVDDDAIDKLLIVTRTIVNIPNAVRFKLIVAMNAVKTIP